METRCCSCRPLCGEGMARVPAREEKVDGGGKGAVEVPVGISNSRLLRVHAQNQVCRGTFLLPLMCKSHKNHLPSLCMTFPQGMPAAMSRPMLTLEHTAALWSRAGRGYVA